MHSLALGFPCHGVVVMHLVLLAAHVGFVIPDGELARTRRPDRPGLEGWGRDDHSREWIPTEGRESHSSRAGDFYREGYPCTTRSAGKYPEIRIDPETDDVSLGNPRGVPPYHESGCIINDAQLERGITDIEGQTVAGEEEPRACLSGKIEGDT